jgi:hypothetical protein
MKKRIKIASIVVAAVAILWTIVNQLLWSQSYSYACWRVTHPFGPNVNAFGIVVWKTQPMHIPILIAKVDDPDAWWCVFLPKPDTHSGMISDSDY